MKSVLSPVTLASYQLSCKLTNYSGVTIPTRPPPDDNNPLFTWKYMSRYASPGVRNVCYLPDTRSSPGVRNVSVTCSIHMQILVSGMSLLFARYTCKSWCPECLLLARYTFKSWCPECLRYLLDTHANLGVRNVSVICPIHVQILVSGMSVTRPIHVQVLVSGMSVTCP
jgi:hypothetical protein